VVVQVGGGVGGGGLLGVFFLCVVSGVLMMCLCVCVLLCCCVVLLCCCIVVLLCCSVVVLLCCYVVVLCCVVSVCCFVCVCLCVCMGVSVCGVHGCECVWCACVRRNVGVSSLLQSDPKMMTPPLDMIQT